MGFFVSFDSGIKPELKHAWGEGTKGRRGQDGLWRNWGINTDVKVGLLESILAPALLY